MRRERARWAANGKFHRTRHFSPKSVPKRDNHVCGNELRATSRATKPCRRDIGTTPLERWGAPVVCSMVVVDIEVAHDVRASQRRGQADSKLSVFSFQFSVGSQRTTDN